MHLPSDVLRHAPTQQCNLPGERPRQRLWRGCGGCSFSGFSLAICCLTICRLTICCWALCVGCCCSQAISHFIKFNRIRLGIARQQIRATVSLAVCLQETEHLHTHHQHTRPSTPRLTECAWLITASGENPSLRPLLPDGRSAVLMIS